MGVRRFIWNWALAKRIELFNTRNGNDKFSNYVLDSRELTQLKKTELPWLFEVSSTVPTQALLDLDKAFKSFWKRRQEDIGFPKFKSRGQRDSFRITGKIEIQSRYVRFPVLGVVRTKDKNIDKQVQGRITSVTVSERAERWFVSIKTEREVEQPIHIVGDIVGVDLGIKTFATFSDGTKIAPLNALKKAEKKLKRAQRKLSKKKKGSNNRKKQQRKVQKIHFDIAKQRSNFIHEITSKLARTKSVVVVEDLDVIGMKFQKQIRDAVFAEFRSQLSYKCVWYGSKLVVVDRYFPSSKTCSCCGYINKDLKLSDREWTCPECQKHHDRDINAAINLKNKAFKVPVSRRKRKSSQTLETPVESSIANSLKQEVI